MGENGFIGRLLHNLFRIPCIIRTSYTMHIPSGTQCITIPSDENSPAEQAKTIQREPKI